MDTNTLSIVVKAIVSEQKLIMGPIAIDQANKVAGVHVDQEVSKIELSGEANQILSGLVSQYQKLFGQASVEACKESVRQLGNITLRDLPAVLQ